MYRAEELGTTGGSGLDLASVCDRLADLPLLFQPGTERAYSMASDVLGRVVEVISGQALRPFFDERIFGPLGMTRPRSGTPSRTSRGWPACTTRPRRA